MVPSKVQGLSFREIRPHKQSSNDLNWFSPDPQSPSTTTPETSSFRLGVFRPLFSLCFLYLIDHLHSKTTTTLAPSSVIRLSILDSSPTLKHSERQGLSYLRPRIERPKSNPSKQPASAANQRSLHVCSSLEPPPTGESRISAPPSFVSRGVVAQPRTHPLPPTESRARGQPIAAAETRKKEDGNACRFSVTATTNRGAHHSLWRR